MENALIIFVQNHEKGKMYNDRFKDIGEDKSLQVHKYMAQHTRDVAIASNCSHFVFYSSYVHIGDSFDDDRFTKFIQEGESSIEKTRNAFDKVTGLGCKHICSISTYCYALETDIIDEAFEKLQSVDVVFGPGLNGIPYLFGTKRFEADWFSGPERGAVITVDDISHLVKNAGLTCFQLPTLPLITTTDDLLQTNIITHIKEGDLGE